MKRRGFTMIEVLTVIAVIVILGGMLLAGSKYIINSSKNNVSRTMLSDLKAMMTERESAVGASKNNTDIDAVYSSAAIDSTTIGPVDEGMAARTPLAGNQVNHTQQVMQLLMAVPANKKMVSNLPTQQFLEGTAAVSPNTPVLMDGFYFPIIAVPSEGLDKVTLNGTATLVRSPDGKPFFASPGPDGNFQTGDDNVYSFNQ